MTDSTEPPSTSNRCKSQGIATRSNATFKPIPMSKMTQSAELSEYTASMKNFLASVEHEGRTENGGNRSDSDSDSDTSGAGTGSEREKSPEFRWMDLAIVRREHGSANLSYQGGGGSDNRVTKGTPSKPSSHHHHHHGNLGKDPRPYRSQRQYRSASPGGKALLSKKHSALVGTGRSTEKN